MRVLVLGAAVSGLAAAGLAASRGAEVIVYDQRPVEAAGLDIRSGEWAPALLEGIDLVVTSPGFPEHAGPIPDVVAYDIPLISEMEYAVSHIPVPYAAVTGTNGKTPVTSVTADMMRASGVDAVAAGNIGNALSGLVASPPEALVVEASSFQLRFIDTFHPSAAAILNIAPDHLDWHRNMAEYTSAKQRIFENQAAPDILVFDADDEGASNAVKGAAARLIPVSGIAAPEGGSGPRGDRLLIAGETYPNPGFDRAYTMDLVAAGELASHLGATAMGIGNVIASFSPGAHRREVVGIWDGVAWVNDSKATNPHAAVASAEAFESVVLIAGGRNKGLDLSPVVAVATIKKVIGIGEAAAEMEAITEADRFTAVVDLAAAITAADSMAEAGDTVLLAPGCASFDMFASYGDRGDEFRRLVTSMKGENHGN